MQIYVVLLRLRVHTFIREKNNHIYTLLGNARAVGFWLDSVGPISFN